MSDNTPLNPGSGGDTVRDIDRSGIKTQIVAFDQGGSAGESLVDATHPLIVKLGDGTNTLTLEQMVTDSEPGTDYGVPAECYQMVFNGTTWDRMRSVGALGGQSIAPQPPPTATTAAIVGGAQTVGPVTMAQWDGVTVVISGTHAGINLTFEGSNDNSVWYPVTAVQTDTGLISSTSGVITSNATRAWDIDVGEALYFRVRSTAWTSGSGAINIVLGMFAGSPAPSVINHAVYNSALPTFATGTVSEFQTDANGRQIVTLQESAPATTGTITSAASAITAPMNGCNSAAILVGDAANTAYAGVNFRIDGSWDGGTTYVQSLQFYFPSALNTSSGVIANQAANRQFFIQANGATHIRVQATAWTSGTANVRVQPVNIGFAQQGTGNAQYVQGGSGSGVATSGNPVRIGTNFNTAPPTVTTGQTVDLQSTNRGELLASISNGAVQAAVKGASIVAAATDPALVVSIAGANSAIKIGDGTNNAVITAASTAPAYTSPALTTTDRASGAPATTAPSLAMQAGGRAATANPTAATNGQLAAAMTDKMGRLVTVASHVRDMVGKQATTITSSTTATTVVTAGGASVFTDITHISITNSSATATLVTLTDGTTAFIWSIPAGGGLMQNFDPPLPATTANTAWTLQCGTSVASIYANVVYAKNL